jgi:hypothetical protein
MRRISTFGLLPLLAAPIIAAAFDHSWHTAPVPQWSQEDAKEFLADSPWVKRVQLDKVRNLSLCERREGGDWDAGIPTGVGIAIAGLFADWRKIEAIEHDYAVMNLGAVTVRWESASPVRAAEVKAGEKDVPKWDGEYYAVAVYDLHPPFRWNLADQLKRASLIKRENKKDLKPSRVVVVPKGDNLATFVYLFPRSVEITAKDRLAFIAQVGRLFVSVNFLAGDMRLEGQLQL